MLAENKKIKKPLEYLSRAKRIIPALPTIPKKLLVLSFLQEVNQALPYIKKDPNNILVLSMDWNVKLELEKNNIKHKFWEECVGEKTQGDVGYGKVASDMTKWVRSLLRYEPFKKMTEYDGVSLFSLNEASTCQNIYKIFKTIAILNASIEREKAEEIVLIDKESEINKTILEIAKSKNIKISFVGEHKLKIKSGILKHLQPYLTKYFRRFKAWERSREGDKFRGKGIPKPGKKVLSALCDHNQVITVEPVIKEAMKNNIDFTLMKFDYVINDDIKNELIKRRMSFIPFERYLDHEIKRKMRNEEKKIRKEWKELKKDKNFRKKFEYGGINLWNLIGYEFEHLFGTETHIVVIFKYLELIRKTIREEKPNLVLVFGETTPLRRSLAVASRIENVPTLFLQHGISMVDAQFGGEDCDKWAVHGNFDKGIMAKMGVSRENINVVGQPRYDILKDRKKIFNKEETCKKVNLDPNKEIILFTAPPSHDEEMVIWKAYEAFKQLKDKQIIVKPHPTERRKHLFKEMAEKYNINPLFVDYMNSFELINCCDLLLTRSSTTGLEAMIFGKPIVNLNLRSKYELIPYVETGSAYGVWKAEDIAPAIKKVLTNKEIRDNLERNTKKFIEEHAYKIDGKSTERVINLIKMIKKKS